MTQPPYSSSWPDPSTPPSQPPPGQPPPGPPGQPQWNPPPGPPWFYPAAGPPGYGQPGGMPGYGYPPPKTNAMAVAAMTVSIGSAVGLVCAFCIAVLAVVPLGGGVTGGVLGFVARRQIGERGERGDGMALAGIIVGFIAAGLGVLLFGLMLFFFGYATRFSSFS